MKNPLFKQSEDRVFDPDDVFFWIDIMGQRYGWTADYVLSMPIPLFLTMQKVIIEVDEKVKEENDRRIKKKK